MPDRYDIVVIGGGIHGVGVAQAAAAQGYSVLLVEKKELASGTSSRSSKLIHGGLRYLETGQFSLVRECLRERAILLRIASDLVQLRDFFVPIYQNTRRRPWQLRIGLTLYASLSGFAKTARFGTVRRADWDGFDGLTTKHLQTVFQYRDAQTDDARLTQAVMRSATHLGAECAIPAKFVAGSLKDDGCEIVIDTNGSTRRIWTTVLVNASGPWANQVLECIRPRVATCQFELVQGAHIIVPVHANRGIYYLEAPQDQRGVFVMPWHEQTMVGTTETPFYDDPDHTHPREAEVRYLLEVFGYYFPQFADLTPDDVCSAFAGLRVLPSGSGRAFNRSREMILHVDRPQRPRILSIYGGKLTAYRATAEKVIHQLAPMLPPRRAIADTRQLRLAA